MHQKYKIFEKTPLFLSQGEKILTNSKSQNKMFIRYGVALDDQYMDENLIQTTMNHQNNE